MHKEFGHITLSTRQGEMGVGVPTDFVKDSSPFNDKIIYFNIYRPINRKEKINRMLFVILNQHATVGAFFLFLATSFPGPLSFPPLSSGE